MKTVNHPSLEIDVKAVAGAAAHKARVFNNGRHHGKMPDMFPDVLADVALAKNVAVEVPVALVPPVKSIIREDEVDDGDKKEDSPPEGKIAQPAIPVDMKQYLQVIAAVAQKQAGGGEPAPPPVIAAAVLPAIIPRNETQGATVKQIEDAPENVLDVPGNASKYAVHTDAPKFLEKKAADPAKSVERKDKSPPILSGSSPSAEPLPEPSENFQPKAVKDVLQPNAPKEVFQPKAAEAELRIIKVETSFSPAASTPFIVQVAKIIADGLGGPIPGPVAVIGSPAPDPRPDVVKSIQIQLHPDDLGKIKVAMHLRGDELKLQIEVTNKAVETLLLNDHQALKDLMGQAGYDMRDASISITVSTADPAQQQRSVAATNPSQDSPVGQGGRQHPGASEDNQNPFQKARGHHVSASDFENGKEPQALAPGPRRGNGVFV